MPEKTEHIQYWLRKDRHFEDADALARQLRYHQGVDDIALARQLAEAQPSLAAFDRFFQTARDAAHTKALAVALAQIYLSFHFDISVMAMPAAERHRRLAALFTKACSLNPYA
jgi:hypothetical protein